MAALYLQGTPSATPATVANAIISTATTGKVTTPNSGSPNKLLFSPLTLDNGGNSGITTAYSGSLSGTNTSQYQPSSSGYTSAGAGTHTGILSGPGSTDFDLYLECWNGSSWTQVATSLNSSSSETINYSATAGGTYRFRVYSYMGSGAYTLTVTRPS